MKTVPCPGDGTVETLTATAAPRHVVGSHRSRLVEFIARCIEQARTLHETDLRLRRPVSIDRPQASETGAERL